MSISTSQCLFALSLALLCSAVPAQDTGPDSLPAAQRRVSAASQELTRAKNDLRREERAVQDAESGLRKAEQKVEEEKKRLEQSRKNLEDAKLANDVAQQKYDDAFGAVQRLYRERQAPSK